MKRDRRRESWAPAWARREATRMRRAFARQPARVDVRIVRRSDAELVLVCRVGAREWTIPLNEAEALLEESRAALASAKRRLPSEPKA